MSNPLLQSMNIVLTSTKYTRKTVQRIFLRSLVTTSKSIMAVSSAQIAMPAQHSHSEHTHEDHLKVNHSSPYTLNKESNLQDYLYNNRLWCEKMNVYRPDIFEHNAKGQQPHTLWIGCADSRYNETVLNIAPGEVFTYKNVGNILNMDELTTTSVLEFTINVLKVKKVIICGHTDCGGVWNSLSHKDLGEQNNHLMKHLKVIDEVRDANEEELEQITDLNQRCKKLAELNVLQQLRVLKKQKVVIQALSKGDIEVWGLMYNVGSGLLEVLQA